MGYWHSAEVVPPKKSPKIILQLLQVRKLHARRNPFDLMTLKSRKGSIWATIPKEATIVSSEKW
jgi:hypothetical protein